MLEFIRSYAGNINQQGLEATVNLLEEPTDRHTHEIVFPAGDVEMVYRGWVISVGGFWWDPNTRVVRKRVG